MRSMSDSCIFGIMLAPCCYSIVPSNNSLNASLATFFPLRSNTLTHGGFFLIVLVLHISPCTEHRYVPYAWNLFSFQWHSYLLSNVAFFYSFSSLLKIWKGQTNKIFQKERTRIYNLFSETILWPLDKEHPYVCSLSIDI